MDQREFVRFNSFNLIYYSLVGSKDRIIWEGVGRTLNMSRGGALIEIDSLIDEKTTAIILEIALEEILFKVRGKIVFTRTTEDSKTELGIRFAETGEQEMGDLIAFLLRYEQMTPRPANLLRIRSSSISNVVLTLSKEHKIINDYVIACRNMLENKDSQYTLKSLESLFEFMERDARDHFQFEENILFRAALAGEHDPEIFGMVEQLRKDHRRLRDQVLSMRTYIKTLMQSGQSLSRVSHDRIDDLMRQVKKHARLEMLNLFPAIDADPEKIRVLNTLMAERKQ